jgi:hypothetical protein
MPLLLLLLLLLYAVLLLLYLFTLRSLRADSVTLDSASQL